MLSNVLEFLPNFKSTYFASMNPPNELFNGDPFTNWSVKIQLSVKNIN